MSYKMVKKMIESATPDLNVTESRKLIHHVTGVGQVTCPFARVQLVWGRPHIKSSTMGHHASMGR
jgi:hypothetical protein